MISQSRWDWLLGEVECYLKVMVVGESTEMTEDEVKMVLNVLKNNTPFQVVPDCVAGKTPLETNNVLLETQNFKVLGDK